MSNWRPWLTEFAKITLLAAVWAALPPLTQNHPSFAIRFVSMLAACLMARAISNLRSGAFLAIKLVFAIGVVFIFKHVAIAFTRQSNAHLVFLAGLFVLLTMLPLKPRVRFSVWLAATKRTLRRLRGDWTEDDQRFYSEIVSKAK
jgi:hypothetical protein